MYFIEKVHAGWVSRSSESVRSAQVLGHGFSGWVALGSIISDSTRFSIVKLQVVAELAMPEQCCGGRGLGNVVGSGCVVFVRASQPPGSPLHTTAFCWGSLQCASCWNILGPRF